jgi:NAD(P)H-flavin reductase
MAGMSMAGMSSMGNGVPSLFYMQQIFWAFIGIAIAIATLANVINKVLYRQRIKSSYLEAFAAKPRSLLFQAHATFSALTREYGYYSIPLSIRNIRFYLPPMGSASVLGGYLILIIISCLYKLDPKDLLEWEDIAYRAGFIAMCQIPLVVLLAGKNNIIGSLTGVGYERLNWLHRWVARSLLLTVVIHVWFWLTEWLKYEYVQIKIQSDDITQKGFIAGGILIWLIISSAAPIRGLSYEVFVVQHVISWLAFLVTLYTHVPPENQIWIWLPLAFWALDRFMRAVLLIYNNLSLFHKDKSGFLACRASFEFLDENHTRITIANPPVTWEAGQHMFLACHSIAPLSSHPFTIASLPSDGRIEFVVCAKRGATRKFLAYASKLNSELPTSISPKKDRAVLLDGPYSSIRPLRQFDSLVLLAGSTGATFTVPLMRDVVQDWMNTKSDVTKGNVQTAGVVTRYIHFIWVVRKATSLKWFKEQLEKVRRDVESLQNGGIAVKVDISVYITSDTGLAASTMQGEFDLSVDGKTNLEDNTPLSERQLSNRPVSLSSEKLHSSAISVVPGRPNISNIVTDTAEKALGEMAVVVCGPAGMVQDTRNAAAKISDDRGVHKGTGAQGIYVHAEAFGYA